jgi:hypothetical protein
MDAFYQSVKVECMVILPFRVGGSYTVMERGFMRNLLRGC